MEELNMEFHKEDYRRLLVANHTRKTAEEDYAKNPLTALMYNLIKWGQALMEFSTFIKDPENSKKMIEGNMSYGLLTPDFSEAEGYLDKACEYFQKAVVMDPKNGYYERCLECARQFRKDDDKLIIGLVMFTFIRMLICFIRGTLRKISQTGPKNTCGDPQKWAWAWSGSGIVQSTVTIWFVILIANDTRALVTFWLHILRVTCLNRTMYVLVRLHVMRLAGLFKLRNESKKEKSSDFKYDGPGWIILAVGIVACAILFSKLSVKDNSF
ncbi:plant-specific import receptor subunit TOM20 [Medicago truncatula]|uniref:Plant-specific import receptor subunit TOM20 n=1 Tax=Medicago truncatula TaxID=3880 RepID=G7JBZ9_MEDTR|nr:plant-specific import receptor subunit TOM20 [Medicago truncatula]